VSPLFSATILLVFLGTTSMPPDLHQAFTAGQYQVMIEEIEARLGEPVGLEVDVVSKLHLWRGFALIGLGDRQAARASFRVALSLDPSLSLNPRDVSPKIMAEFQAAKSAVASTPSDTASETRYLLLSDERPTAAVRSLVIPGWGQWTMERKTRGVVFASLGLVALGGYVVSGISEHNAREEYLSATGDDISSKYNTYNRWHKANDVFGYGVMMVWAGAVMDVLLGPPYHVHVSGTREFLSLGVTQPLP
jgi:hypothetical protein